MIIAAIITVLADQLTKLLAAWKLSGDRSVTIIPDFFDLRLVHNEGAAWGILQGQRAILVAVSVIMLGFVVRNRKEFAKNGRFSGIMLGVLSGGITGNLIDRLLTGKVVDFLDFHWKDFYNFPVFNIADTAICVGIFFLFATQFKHREQNDAPEPANPEPANPEARESENSE